MNFRADLHCHTTCSDGTLTPEEVVALAKERDLAGLAITDHDSVTAFKRALPVAEKLGVGLISGVEFTAAQRAETVHVLGYALSPEHPAIKTLCDWHLHRRRKRLLKILEKLHLAGIPIKEGDIPDVPLVGRPHIAAALVKIGEVKTIAEAFHRFLGDGKSCYVPSETLTVEETVEVIHKANGLAVLAHPHLMKNGRILREVLELPLDGIECYYASFPKEKERRWIEIAEEKNLLKTGGSDFHGEVKPHNRLGASWVGEELFRILQERQELNLQ